MDTCVNASDSRRSKTKERARERASDSKRANEFENKNVTRLRSNNTRENQKIDLEPRSHRVDKPLARNELAALLVSSNVVVLLFFLLLHDFIRTIANKCGYALSSQHCVVSC